MKQMITKALLAAAFMATAVQATADSFTIEPFTIAAGEEKVVTLHLNGTRKYIAFQADIYLPEGITIKEDADGLYLDVVPAMTNSRNGHTVMGNLNGDHYTIIVDHPQNAEFQNESGDVVEMTLVASDQISTGQQNITLRHQVLNDAAVNQYNFDDSDHPFTAKIDVAVTSLGYATFSWPRALDFTDTGVRAFIAKEVDEVVHLTEVTTVPANTGLVLKGTAGTYNPQTLGTDDLEIDDLLFDGNLLVSNTEGQYTVGSGGNIYVLSKKNETPGFYLAGEGLHIAQYKSYLLLTDGARSFIGFGNNTTGIADTVTCPNDGEYYDLQGRRMKSSIQKKGIYVKQGKKVVIK